MGIKITKENIDELITAFIDNQNEDRQIKEEISAMVENNEILRKKYRTEFLTKNLLKNRLRSAEVPEKTVRLVNNAIDTLISSSGRAVDTHPLNESTTFLEYLKDFFAAPLLILSFEVPRYVAALIFVSVILFIGILVSSQNNTEINPYIASGSENSIMVQAVNNFHKIQSGEVVPEMHKDVPGFLKKKLSFEPFVPALSGFELMGCICNKFKGENLAHIVYGSGGNIIYIYQTDINSMNETKLEIPKPVYDKVLKEKYYMCDHVDEENCTLLIWSKDNVLCASVSNIPKNNLYSKFITEK